MQRPSRKPCRQVLYSRNENEALAVSLLKEWCSVVEELDEDEV
jgi:hypothetical protein